MMKKPVATLDLTSLDRTVPETAVKQQTVAAEVLGRPLQIPVNEIDEDPTQPRQEFNSDSMDELVQSITIHGVKTPVSIRPHPTGPKKWILNFGARRLRASKAAGKNTIPAFIDRSHNDYQQVIENLQREELKPRELAMFIKRKMDDGDKQARIAELLGVNRSMVTNHLALIDPPNCIDEIYSTGRCTSAKTLYDLRNLHKEFPSEVEQWCAGTEDITRATVSALAGKLKGTTGQEETNGSGDEVTVASTTDSAAGQGSTKSKPRDGKGSAATEPTVPSIIIMFHQRSGTLDLRHAPAQPNHVIVNFADGKQEEVPARECHIDQIIF